MFGIMNIIALFVGYLAIVAICIIMVYIFVEGFLVNYKDEK